MSQPLIQPSPTARVSASLLAIPASLWTHRSLIRRLVVREIDARYRGSVLGIARALIGQSEPPSGGGRGFFRCGPDSQLRRREPRHTEELDRDHGRLEVRRYWISETLCTLPDTGRWVGLRTIGTVERTCKSGDTQTLERRYFINAIGADAERFARAVRGHWGSRTGSTGVWTWSSTKTPAASAKATPRRS